MYFVIVKHRFIGKQERSGAAIKGLDWDLHYRWAIASFPASPFLIESAWVGPLELVGQWEAPIPGQG